MVTRNRTNSDILELGYIHDSPFSSISITGVLSRPHLPPHVLHADYEGIYITTLSSGIVLKFAPSYRVLTSHELKPTESFTWNFGLVPAHTTTLNHLKRQEAARYNSIEICRKRTLAREGQIMNLLSKSLESDPCVNIMQPHLSTREGLFLPRMESSIQSRLDTSPLSPSAVPMRLKLRWSLQIAHSLSWLARRSHFHGDLKPGNVLLDIHDNAILSDFGSCAKTGDYLQTGCGVYTFGWGKGGAETEAYAFGWTVYDVFHGGHAAELDEKEPGSKVVFPPTEDMGGMGEVVRKCWRREYKSVEELEREVKRVYEAEQSEVDREVDRECEARATREMEERKEGFKQRMEELYLSLQDCVVEEVEEGKESKEMGMRPRATTN